MSLVQAALDRAEAAGFTISSEPPAGALLAVLSAAVPPGGRILEIGTGAGVGLAWLVEGLGGRTDVEVRSVERDPRLGALTAAADWPENVTLHGGDVLELFDTLGTFDLIFADAQGGKSHGLDRTIAALAPGGHLLVDDMAADQEQIARVRDTLLAHPGLTAVELPCGTGLILATRNRQENGAGVA
ncbi:class I SAM-dependent methyltransferase [Actinoplanes sp. NPDC051411]|uniref:O-methyltransferase n=1 Tax=Actinoplanes sp. NPDC051411 TaxID=3155522 RepID=UPI00344567FD